MYKYYVNRDKTGNPNNDHEVHKEGCVWCPSIEKRIYLGNFSNCADAVKAAKAHYDNVDGCATCCSSCHRA